MNITIKTADLVCASCNQKYQSKAVIFASSGRTFYPKLCASCEELLSRTGASPKSRWEEWAKKCPHEYRTTAEGGATSLEEIDKGSGSDKWRQMLSAWELNDKGLFFFGPPGTCKTRIMWRIVRSVFHLRVPVYCGTGGAFERECRDAMHSGNMTEWFQTISQAPVLFIDDIFKMNMTDFIQTSLFDLIDERTKNGLPLLATTNDTEQSLCARIPGDKVAPLIRRINEYFTVVNFFKP